MDLCPLGRILKSCCVCLSCATEKSWFDLRIPDSYDAKTLQILDIPACNSANKKAKNILLE